MISSGGNDWQCVFVFCECNNFDNTDLNNALIFRLVSLRLRPLIQEDQGWEIFWIHDDSKSSSRIIAIMDFDDTMNDNGNDPDNNSDNEYLRSLSQTIDPLACDWGLSWQ